MTFQPPDWWYESWVGEWAEEGFSVDEQLVAPDVVATAEDMQREGREWSR